MNEPRLSTLVRIGPLELALMTVLWDRMQPMTGRAIHELIDYPGQVEYTTVATVLGNLCTKGRATRVKKGRPWYFRAAQSREEYLASCVRVLLAETLNPGEVLALALRPGRTAGSRPGGDGPHPDPAGQPGAAHGRPLASVSLDLAGLAMGGGRWPG
jgi:predicted transcriptional regulator